jgi:hypothetical protein
MNNIINEMCTLINYNGEWTIEPSENVVIQEFHNNNNYIGAQCYHFRPLNGIINNM